MAKPNAVYHIVICVNSLNKILQWLEFGTISFELQCTGFNKVTIDGQAFTCNVEKTE